LLGTETQDLGDVMDDPDIKEMLEIVRSRQALAQAWLAQPSEDKDTNEARFKEYVASLTGEMPCDSIEDLKPQLVLLARADNLGKGKAITEESFMLDVKGLEADVAVVKSLCDSVKRGNQNLRAAVRQAKRQAGLQTERHFASLALAPHEVNSIVQLARTTHCGQSLASPRARSNRQRMRDSVSPAQAVHEHSV
jgi:hypothetical protein